jgi:SAM-dependent methyltransferase
VGLNEGALGFGPSARIYERSRPSYPRPAVDELVGRLRIDTISRVVELGAGTGKFTRLLRPHAGVVIAVEPIAGMRAEFTAVLPDVPLLAGLAEQIPVASGAADAVVAAQAFHWFETDVALAEIHRVLRPDGGLGLVWNRRDDTVPWVAQLKILLEPYEGATPREWRRLWERPEWEQTGFSPLEQAEFSYEQELDADGLCGRVASISFVAALDDDERARVLADVRDLVAGFDERFVLPYRTGVHWCRRR